MSIFGDDLPLSSTQPPTPGEDLYGLSVDELGTRIALYRAEIVRLEAERAKKQAETDAAHAIFGKKSK
ncbi:hypothetical protein GCM10011309_18920 [Litorimonas cladophorae]|uniref:DUF1192 domain-containing protein n=1 Tax=Litorimonas cladophorae TaxID=1220491 RepID=A0A918KMR1_9PROT|nr:DUF1192 domain-containing protein [Litorimonas cladophorae]GGX69193.1 hypothetical protein GCM10011309_18920 [Litorimonas cladophorae]